LLTEAGAPEPPPNGLGTGMAGPTVAAYGTDAQKRRWLSRIFCSGEWWCQLFSEPGAGSDIASLACRAVADDGEWVVNGQKVWTSGAQHSDWGLLVVRTDSEVPKHRGMSFFVVDMHSSGVDVRPLRNMTGLSEFNEVFLTDVRLCDTDRLGPVGDGWRVLMTTLMNERLVFTGAGGPTDATVLIEDALRAWREREDRDPALRDRLVQTWIAVEVQRLFNLRAAEARQQGTPGHEGSLGKLAATELNKKVTELTMDLLGPPGMLLPGAYTDGRSQRRNEGAATAPVLRFLRARANTIEGGTSEVQRNNIADHVLGLPVEERLDKTLPWSQVPRSV
jgi:alkylation response protein AidB-like acyl-CoA dehydrogenase